MIIYVLITSLIPLAAGFRILVHSVIHAPVGFEDESGFHRDVSALDERAASAYSGPERRAPRRDESGSPASAPGYSGPRRRMIDFKPSEHLEMPHLGGFA